MSRSSKAFLQLDAALHRFNLTMNTDLQVHCQYETNHKHAIKEPFVQHVCNHLQKSRLLIISQLRCTIPQSYANSCQEKQKLLDNSLLVK